MADLEADVEDPGEFEDWEEEAPANGDAAPNGESPPEDPGTVLGTGIPHAGVALRN